jgi:hypothetical protein
VIEGYLFAERARGVYGVVLNPATFEVQVEATRKARASKAATTGAVP